MIPHIHTLFEFISIPYENQHQTLSMKKIDRGQIRFREYSITLLQPEQCQQKVRRLGRITCAVINTSNEVKCPLLGNFELITFLGEF